MTMVARSIDHRPDPRRFTPIESRCELDQGGTITEPMAALKQPHLSKKWQLEEIAIRPVSMPEQDRAGSCHT